ncbi:hypothetical protein ACLBYD_26565 [Rhodococcus sp. C26F]
MDTLTRSHADTTKMPIHEVVRYFLDRLGSTLVAYIAGARSRAIPAKWAIPPT